jgi:hypothetical protein
MWTQNSFTSRMQLRESYSQIRMVLYLSLFCVNQWEGEKYFILFRYWLKLKGTLPMSW